MENQDRNFLTNFLKMTFDGKGIFWAACGVILIVVLVYMFSSKIRDFMKRTTKAWLILPVLLLGYLIYSVISSSIWVPISQRNGDNPVAYRWEITAEGKNELTLDYISDIKDPATGSVYQSKFKMEKEAEPDNSPKTRFGTEKTAAEAFTVATDDGTAEITFNPDGTYLFTMPELGLEETGVYEYAYESEKSAKLNLTSAAGNKMSGKGTNRLKLDYETDAKDPEKGKSYKAKFNLKEGGAKEDGHDYSPETLFSEAGTVAETTEVAGDDGSAIIFNPDGTYRYVSAGGAEEAGEYLYRNKILTMANASGSAAFWKNMRQSTGWLVLIGLGIVLVVLAYVFNDKIRLLLKNHPLVWLCIPAALLIYFVYVAIGWNIWVSVSDWPEGSVMPTYGWGGFGQYAKMFSGNTGEYFWNAVKNTLLLFLIIPICLLLGLGLALVMDHGLRGTPVFRTLILLPFSLSFVVTGAIWQQMYRGDDKGIILKFFSMFGIDTSGILWMNSDMVMVSIMIVMIWQFSGYVAVIFLAAIKNVPVNIVNAAKLDGAYMPRIYRKMIIPQLKGAMGSCITILAMYALRSFDLIVSLTNEANSASQTLPVLMYYEGFKQNNYAYAAAISCFLLALVLVLILPLTYWTNRRKA